MREIKRYLPESIILLISHRLSTILSADRIIVLADGKNIAEGKHEWLYENVPEYRHLFQTQILKE
ncbi:MAG: hypothetical protein ACP5JR_03975 [Thermoplasmata archaeon]